MFDTESFIKEIELRPALWDVNSEIYKDRDAKVDCWYEVAETMTPKWDAMTDKEKETEVKELQVKWKNIKDYYRKCINDDHKKTGNPKRRKKKKYVFYDNLHFIAHLLGEGSQSGGAFDSVEVSFANDSDSEQETEEIPKPYQNTYAKRAFKLEKDDSDDSTLAKIVRNDLKTAVSTPTTSKGATKESDDGDRLFLMLLLPDLKKMSDSKKRKCKIELMQVVDRMLQEDIIQSKEK